MIEFVNLHKSFGRQQVLRGVNLTIPHGQITAIIGQSGSGKSVLIKHLVALIRPDSDRCWSMEQNSASSMARPWIWCGRSSGSCSKEARYSIR